MNCAVARYSDKYTPLDIEAVAECSMCRKVCTDVRLLPICKHSICLRCLGEMLHDNFLLRQIVDPSEICVVTEQQLAKKYEDDGDEEDQEERFPDAGDEAIIQHLRLDEFDSDDAYRMLKWLYLHQFRCPVCRGSSFVGMEENYLW
jgi:hypothetical protein